MMKPLNIILGGTHGLGREIANQLRARDEMTFVTGRSYDETEHGSGMVVNLAQENSAQGLLQYVRDLRDATINRFFWVAGYGYSGDFGAQSDPQAMADVNFAHVLPIAQAVWRRMLQNPAESSFVVVSSSTGIKARADEAVYAATKHAQVGFTRSLGLESERLEAPIKVALFLPGGMQTPFWEGNEPENLADFLDPVKVAQRIVERVLEQQGLFYEEEIPRGSL